MASNHIYTQGVDMGIPLPEQLYWNSRDGNLAQVQMLLKCAVDPSGGDSEVGSVFSNL